MSSRNLVLGNQQDKKGTKQLAKTQNRTNQTNTNQDFENVTKFATLPTETTRANLMKLEMDTRDDLTRACKNLDP